MGWKPNCSGKKFKEWCKENWLLLFTIGSVAAGIALGFIMRSADFTQLQRYYWGFIGEVIVMNMLKMIIVPIVTLSIMCGIADLAGSQGRLAVWGMSYYALTTVLSIILGIVMTLIVKPGKGVEPSVQRPASPQSPADGLLDIVRNIFPPNIISALFQQASTRRTNGTYGGVAVSWSGTEPSQGPRPNVLGVIMFCAVFGFFLGKLKQKGNTNAAAALNIFNGMNDAVMELVDLIMWIHPIGLLFLISNKIMGISSENAEIWGALGWLIFTTLMSIFIHACITIPTIYYLVTKKNPFTYFLGVAQAISTAWATASSAATMPITLRNLETKNKIDRRVTRFMVPVGATINMDGTALYEAVAALFIAQINGVNLSFGKILIIAITGTVASVGAAAVPSAGLVTLIIVLTAVDLPLDDIAWIYTVDWFLDRFRTATNVWGDSIGCGVVQHICQDELDEQAGVSDLLDKMRT